MYIYIYIIHIDRKEMDGKWKRSLKSSLKSMDAASVEMSPFKSKGEQSPLESGNTKKPCLDGFFSYPSFLRFVPFE